MRLFCIHKWIKIETEPHFRYWDYECNPVGVFKCRCVKCGKVKDRKFLKS